MSASGTFFETDKPVGEETPKDSGNGGVNRILKVAVNQVGAVAHQLGVTIEENQEFSQQIYSDAKVTADLNQENQTELDQMRQEFGLMVGRLETMKMKSDRMEESGQKSQQALVNSMSGIRDTIKDFDQINRDTQETRDMMNELHQLTFSVTKILKTVADISEQTRLLSLNATIEAARAGQAGAGFGIVADWIKRLADSSRESVENIQKIVDQILNANTAVNQRMDATAAKVDVAAHNFQRIDLNLHEIQNSFEVLVANNQKINEEVAKQQERSIEIQAQVETVHDQSQQVVEHIEAVYLGLKKQQSLIAELNDLGNRLNQASATLQPMIFDGDDRLSLKDEFQNKAREMLASLKRELLVFKNGYPVDTEHCRFLVAKLLKTYPFLEAAWVNDPKGRFVHSTPPAGIANAKVRDWFVNSLNGTEFVTVPYISAITGNPCVTLALPIYDADDRIRGILGVDFQC